MANIHPSSIVSDQTELAEDVVIGPFCIVEGDVTIASGTRLLSHVIVGSDYGKVVIGSENQIYPHSVIGGPPQDLSYTDQKTELHIGDRNIIREGANINLGTEKGGSLTKIGSDNLIMSLVHIGHDVQIGSNTVIASSSNIAGHCELADHVKVGGMVGITQFCRLGEHSYVAGVTAINKDVLPYTIAQGNWATMRAPNKVGMDRFGYSKEEIQQVSRAIRIVTKGGHTKEEAVERIKKECGELPPVLNIINFIEKSSRGLAI
ncbi:MAG: acyl-ACP--UDP-N-acetylglucosamine O-acyltransferase [Bdellovibrionales bacterium]